MRISILLVVGLLLAACVPTTASVLEPTPESQAEIQVEDSSKPPAVTQPAATPTLEPVESTIEPTPTPVPIKVGFLAADGGSFDAAILWGAEQAAADLGFQLLAEAPEQRRPAAQSSLLDAVVARGDLDFLIVAPVDKQAMIAPLQRASEAGLPLLTVDTFLGDGDYEYGPVQFPHSHIGSKNIQGGFLGCTALAEEMGGVGKVYIQNSQPGISTTRQREESCYAALDRYPDIRVIGVDYNENDPANAQAQTQAMLQRTPKVRGIVGIDLLSAQGAGQAVADSGLSGKVKVLAFADSPAAIDLLREGRIDLVVTQQPVDMGYLAVLMANAYLHGVDSIPRRITTGYTVITRENIDDPRSERILYAAGEAGAPPPTEKYQIGFLAAMQDPFNAAMQHGAAEAAEAMGYELVTGAPDQGDADAQAAMLRDLSRHGALDFLVIAPNDTEALIAPARRAANAGLPLLTVDTVLGDGDYENGSVTFPLSHIGSDDIQAGYFSCSALAESIAGAGRVYIQNIQQGVTRTDLRELGCRAALQEFPGIELAGVDYNQADPALAQSQTQAALKRFPDLDGVFAMDAFSAQGVGQAIADSGLSGQTRIAVFDANQVTIDLLMNGVVDLVIAQKPGDMGFLAVTMANAYLNGVESIPAQIPTGFVVITRDTIDEQDPYARKGR